MKSYKITDACMGCTLCAKNCPVGAISGNLKEKHTINEQMCISCGLCGKLCAKGAIADSNGVPAVRVPKSEWLTPAVNGAICAGCSVCVEACPKSCLAISEPTGHGDTHTVAVLANEKDCIGCGLCEKSCPVGAIKMVSASEKASPDFGEADNKKGAFSMYKAYCRVFQGVMKIGNYFMGYRMPEYVEGPGSIKNMASMLKEKGVENVLVVTDPSLTKLGLPNGMYAAMDAAGIKYSVFDQVEPNPTSDNVEAGLKVFLQNGCKALIGFGGGAPMDCAKAIASRSVHPNKSVAQLQGLLKVHKKIPLFFAVPTTSGTGSETTVAAVIIDSASHRKASINDPCIIPKYAILDPELTVGLPPFVTATTGLDALCHAVEAYTNKTYNTPLENKLAKDAVKLIYENLFTAFSDGKNLDARQAMQRAAFFAGRAFTRGCVGYVHAIGHTLGSLYGVSHGLAMSIILPHVMREFGPAVYDRLADLADVCGIGGKDNKEKALGFIGWIEKLKADMNIPVGANMIKEEDIPQIIEWAQKEANPLYPVPVIWNRDEMRSFIEKLRKA